MASPFSAKKAFVAALFVAAGAATTWKALGPGRPPDTPGPSGPNAARDAGGAPPEASSARPFASYGGPKVLTYPARDGGRHTTIVQVGKTDGPWEAGRAWTFDIWFDGPVDSEFEGRGFEDPVAYDVTFPEPGHIAITVRSAPIDAARYVAFEFKSARPVSVVRVATTPRDAGDPADASPSVPPSGKAVPSDAPP